MIKQTYQIIPSRYTDDQRILEFHSTKDKPDHTKPRGVVVDGTFPWWLSPCKNRRYRLFFLQWCCWSKNLATWLDERDHKPHSNASSLKCYLHLTTDSAQKNLRYHLIHSWDFNDQRILHSDWTRAASDHPHSRLIFSNLTLLCWLSLSKKSNVLIPSKNTDDQRILRFIRTTVTADRTQLKVVVLDATFPRLLCSRQKS